MVADTISFKVGGHVLSLETAPDVFQPNTTSRFLIESIGDPTGRSVLDLGCGVGPIAICMALMGADRVHAVDIMPEACELARRNARKNHVEHKVTVIEGDLFDALRDTDFDIIVDDVSGMADEVARLSTWYPEPIPTGGLDGTQQTIEMLRRSRAHLRGGGELIFPVLSLAASKKIITVAEELYGDRLELLSTRRIPFNQALIDNLDRMHELREQGLIDFAQSRSRYLWTLDIYRARAS